MHSSSGGFEVLGGFTSPVQAGRTTLYYPKSLSAIYGNKEEWAVSGSFLT